MTLPVAKRARRIRLVSAAFVTVTLVISQLSSTAQAAAPTVSVANLQVDNLIAPVGIDNATPTLSWSLSGTSNGDAQTQYQVRAASTAAALSAGTGLLWDSGMVSSPTEHAVYAGSALGSRAQVFWQVQAWDSAGATSGWVQSSFELGLTPSSWSASWITDRHWTGTQPGIDTNSTGPISVSFSPVQARYVRLNISKLGLQPSGDSRFFAQLAELQAFGPGSSQTDLALGKTVTTSDSQEGYGWSRGLLTDGVTDTQDPNAHGWTTTGSSSADVSASPVLVTVDLGSVQTVSSVNLWPRTDYLTSTHATTSFPVNYSLQTSSTDTQAASFTVSATVTNQAVPPVPTPPTTVRFSTVQARYLKLNITKLGLAPGGSSYYAQLAEFQAFGPNTAGDLAAGKTVTTSESLENYGWGRTYLTDGVTDTQDQNAHGWSTNGTSSADVNAAPVWATIDLGSVQSVSSVKIFQRTDAFSSAGTTASFPVDYSIQTSATDAQAASFTVAASVTAQADPPVATTTTAAMPLLAKQFSTTGTVAKARLYVSGIGIVVPSLNGGNVGTSVLQPGDSALATRLGYSDYDVTSAVKSNAANALGIALGLGDRYVQPNSPAQGNRYVKFSATSATGLPRAIAQLEITYTDGSTQTVGTDGTWSSILGPTTVTSWYGGESYDAQREVAGWNQPGTDRSSWSSASVTTAPFTTTALVGQNDPPLTVVGQHAAVDKGSPASGVELYDFGINSAGWEQFTINAPKGTTLTFTPSEILQNGRAYQGAGTGTPIYDTFTSNGTTETWHPSFMYHGFRYLEISGLSSAVTITGGTQLVIRANATSVGTFSTSDSTVNSIHSLVDRAVQSNLMSILTDCPDREKLGWQEEDHLLLEMIARNYDVDAYGRNSVQNLAEAQLSNGLVPDIAPEATVFTGGFRDDVNWGSSMIQMPWALYQNYGDLAVLSKYYVNMAKYQAYLDTRATGSLVVYGSSGLGDWGEGSVTSVSTPIDLVENWGYYRDELAMANIATALGKTSDASTYNSKAAATLSAFTAKWYDSTNKTVANGTQSALAMALDIGAIPTADIAAVVAKLVTAVNTNGLAVGEIGLTPMFRVLSQNGQDALLYTLVTANKVGGYGYFVAQGETSLPEYWNLSGSQNHFMLGGVDYWMNAHLIGITQSAGSVGFKNLLFKPSVVGGMTNASGSLQTPYGLASSSWTKGSSGTTLTVGVPTGSTATVYVPITGSTQPVTPSGATYVGTANSYAQYTVGSGSWTFAPA